MALAYRLQIHIRSLPTNMSTTPGKQKGGQATKKGAPASSQLSGAGDEILDNIKATVTSQWDYKAALAIITILAFITRFWGIGHPNEVVFDEVHFGKVGGNSLATFSCSLLLDHDPR